VAGPTLLFERYVSEQSLPRRYYACSACRSRKECQFFQWADQRKSNKRSVAKCKQHEATHYQLHEALFSRQESLCLLLNPYNNNVFYWCISKYMYYHLLVILLHFHFQTQETP